MPASTTLAFANVSHTIEAGYRTPVSGTGTTTIVAYGLAGGYTSLMALASTSTSTIIETPQFYVIGTLSPTITYISSDITGETATFTYSRLPSNTELVFVNTTSGTVTPGASAVISAGGSGTTTISTAGITSYGQYYLRARDASTHTTPNYTQSVNFYISDPSGGDGL
jgi:hypothetical protein